MEGWDMSQTDLSFAPIKYSKRRRKKVIPTIPEKWRKEILSEKPRTFKLILLNPFITCPICQGYLVDATTITECLHSFCRSCIVKHFENLETNYTCPLCNELVHKTNPWYNLKADSVLQDVVAKLVPGFTEAEERRRKIFYKSRGLPVPEKVLKLDKPRCEPLTRVEEKKRETPCNSPQPSPQPSREHSPQPTTNYSNCEENGQITMQLEMKSMDEFIHEEILPLKRKFVRCSGEVTVGLLQKFIARKLSLQAANQVEIVCNDMELGTDFTLKFIQETIADEDDHSKPLLMFYGLNDLE